MHTSLNQDAIDRLFRGIESYTTTEVHGSLGAEHTVEAMDWTRSKQLSAEQVRALTMLHDTFARHATHNIGAWLRSGFSVTLTAVEQLPYEEFIARFEEPSYCASMRISPMGALMASHMEITLAPPLVDLLLGGEGQAGVPAPLTAIEEAILRSVMENIARELSSSWTQTGLEVQFERRHVLAQMLRLLPGNERTLSLDFEVRMDSARGSLNFAIPNVAGAAMLARLNSEHGRKPRNQTEARRRMEHLLQEVAFGASLQLPAMRLPASVLRRLRAGDVLPLPVPLSTPAVWIAGGEPMFTARAGRQGEHRAAHLIAPLPARNSSATVPVKEVA